MRKKWSEKQQEQWAAERREKLADLHQRIAAEVGKLTDSDQWRRWLSFAARFHGYSFNNVLLIMSQRPDATWVASYTRWKAEFGRQVRKGEKGIAILAPVTRRAPASDAADAAAGGSDSQASGNGQPSEDDQADQPRIVAAFKPAFVFDISQTDGPAVDVPDGPTLAEVEPQLLAGQAPAGLWDELVRLAEARGYRVERGYCNGANGFTDYTQRLIKVRDDVDDAQAAKTMIHELGHVDLHTPQDFGWGTTRGCRGEREVEAESVAFLVAEHYGLDTSTYTFAYVAVWAQRAATETGTSPEDIVRAAGPRIVTAAFRISEAVDSTMSPEAATVSPALTARVSTGLKRGSTLRARAEAATERRIATDAAPASGSVASAAFLPPSVRRATTPTLGSPGTAGAHGTAARRGPRLP